MYHTKQIYLLNKIAYCYGKKIFFPFTNKLIYLFTPNNVKQPLK